MIQIHNLRNQCSIFLTQEIKKNILHAIIFILKDTLDGGNDGRRTNKT